MAKNVAVKENTAVGQVLDFAADAGVGLEGADKASFAIPFITLLQPLSPQVEPVKDGGVAGAEAGMLLNSITNELYDEVHVVPCAYQRRFLRWAPRSSGGGFKGSYSPLDVETGKVEGLTLDDAGHYMLGEDLLSDTRNHFVLVVDPKKGTYYNALISLSSTQVKKSKRWMSRIQGLQLPRADGTLFTPPSFSHIYKITSENEENAKGKWKGYKIELLGPVSDAGLYAAAKLFNQQVAAGGIEVTPPEAEAPVNDKF